MSADLVDGDREFQTVGASIENDLSANELMSGGRCSSLAVDERRVLRGVFQGLPEATKPTAPRPLLSLYGIINVTWYTSENDQGIRGFAFMRYINPRLTLTYQKLPESDCSCLTATPC